MTTFERLLPTFLQSALSHIPYFSLITALMTQQVLKYISGVGQLLNAMPRWEEVLHQIDQAYVLEYAIADKAKVVHKVLQEWEL
jgi:hypothetical protein